MTPGSWADWVSNLANDDAIGDSGHVIKLADRLAESAAISLEAALAQLLWLGSICMIQHAQVEWESGIWQPAGLSIAVVEDDGAPIDSIANAFIEMAKFLGIDPIHDTVKEGPAGLISRLESAGDKREAHLDPVTITSLIDLATLDTSALTVKRKENRGNARALIYPSGRALMSYLYDTPFFNTLDELLQHGNLNLRGKQSAHQIRQVHMSLLATFYQGSLVTLTSDSRVQNNMTALLRQMLVFWPTFGIRRYKRPGRIDIALHNVQRIAAEGILSLEELSDGILRIPSLPDAVDKPFIDPGVGVRYTVLNRKSRVSRLALAVAFWRIAAGGRFEITNSDLALADAILHMHEMGGRLYEMVMSKGKLGHEFMRLFIRFLDGEVVELGEEIGQSSDFQIGATALGRLHDLSIAIDGRLAPEYRLVTGQTIRAHAARWKIKGISK